jgi:hypothetical protein
MIEIAAGCPGISSYANRKHVVVPVPEQYLGCYVPGPWQERVLPAGAFTSLWPDGRGQEWSRIKPEGWGPDWRPDESWRS